MRAYAYKDNLLTFAGVTMSVQKHIIRHNTLFVFGFRSLQYG